MSKGDDQMLLAISTAHKAWQADRGGVALASFLTALDQERAFASADRRFAQTVSHLVIAAATKRPIDDDLALARSMDDPNYQELVEEPKEE